ncbi:MAG: hypothetical protein IJS14_04295 [Lentisphaeria bacterium]|nr:hypothetical protein [Lentisphaeria bacterium]
MESLSQITSAENIKLDLFQCVFPLEKTSERNILKRDKNVNVFPLGEERMEKLLVLSFLFTVVLTIPGFLCSVILLIIAKEWKWLALTVGNLLFFLFPELLLAFLIIPAMI